MNKLSLIVCMSISVMAADVEVKNIEDMFKNGKLSGQIEAMYSDHQIDNNINPYSTAIGGQLMYKTASLNSFSAAVEFTTIHEIGGISGDNSDAKRATMMLGVDSHYTDLSQAFLEYGYEGLTLRVGRQLIDTPLADSDDIRIINNTFQGSIVTYDINSFSIMAGYLDKWQGTDSGLNKDNHWLRTGQDGTYLAGVSYSSDLLDTSAWYYDISGESDATIAALFQNAGSKSIYVDTTVHAISNDDFSLDISAQYLDQSEEDNSNVEAKIYGLMIEASIGNLGLMAAYNDRSSEIGKSSFSGFGGGTLFTNMDNMIIDVMSNEDANVFAAGISYSFSEVTLSYMYGGFNGDKDTNNAKEEIIEQDFVVEYAASKNLTLLAVCTINDDREDTGTGAIYSGGDFENYRLSLAYMF